MSGTNWRLLSAAMLFVATGLLVGCSGETPTGGERPASKQVSSISIIGEPAALTPGWTLTGPEDYSATGAGDSLILNLEPGTYTLTWAPVQNMFTPPVDTRPVLATKRERFEGRYHYPATGTATPPALTTVTPDSVANDEGDFYTFVMGSPEEIRIQNPDGSWTVIQEGELGRFTNELWRAVLLRKEYEMATNEVTFGDFTDAMQWALENGHVTVDAREGLVRDGIGTGNTILVDLNAISGIMYNEATDQFGCSHRDLPILGITWYAAASYCDWLSISAGLPRAYHHGNWECNGEAPYRAAGYRLPTEAEWEYACRAGSTTAYYGGENTSVDCEDPELGPLAWYCGNSGSVPHVPGSMTPNAWGFNDMHGNVWEWCNDWAADYALGTPYDPADPDGVFKRRPVAEPKGPGRADADEYVRIIRGGGWNNVARYCRSAQRGEQLPATTYDTVGLRMVKTVAP